MELPNRFKWIKQYRAEHDTMLVEAVLAYDAKFGKVRKFTITFAFPPNANVDYEALDTAITKLPYYASHYPA